VLQAVQRMLARHLLGRAGPKPAEATAAP